MSDFFKPWRRKVGVVTLVLACVFAAGWVRSRVLADSVGVSAGRQPVGLKHGITFWNLASADGLLIFGRVWVEHSQPKLIHPIESRYRYPLWETVSDFTDFKTDNLEFKWRLCGFGLFVMPALPGREGWRLLIPYWSITVPLTLTSAWLLLSKPRQAKPRTTEPIAITGESNA